MFRRIRQQMRPQIALLHFAHVHVNVSQHNAGVRVRAICDAIEDASAGIYAGKRTLTVYYLDMLLRNLRRYSKKHYKIFKFEFSTWKKDIKNFKNLSKLGKNARWRFPFLMKKWSEHFFNFITPFFDKPHIGLLTFYPHMLKSWPPHFETLNTVPVTSVPCYSSNIHFK